MNEFACPGLDGSNPLHFLASLGVMRLLDRDGFAPRLAWSKESGSWNPVVFAEQLELDSCCLRCATWLTVLGEETSQSSDADEKEAEALREQIQNEDKALKAARKNAGAEAKARGLTKEDAKQFVGEKEKTHRMRIQELKKELDKACGGARYVRDLGAALGKAREALKEARKKARSDAKAHGLKKNDANQFVDKQTKEERGQVENLQNELDKAKSDRADSLGDGLAHFGDNLKVSVDLVREKQNRAVSAWFGADTTPLSASQADRVLVADQLAALCYENGVEVRRTPYSFGNGSGGQNLLKDFRLDARACTHDQVRFSLLGDPRRFVDGEKETVRGLGWDPADQASYALSWNNPEDINKTVDVAANALAYIGLGCLCVMPGIGEEIAVAWNISEKAFRWLVWEPQISLPVVKYLLASNEPMEMLRRRGVREAFTSRRIDPTKKSRFYFTPSIPAD